MGVFVAIANQLSSEIKKTIDVCFKMAGNCNEPHQIQIKMWFLRTADEVYLRDVKLSARGIFTIDNALFVFVATTIGTYVTVIFQSASK